MKAIIRKKTRKTQKQQTDCPTRDDYKEVITSLLQTNVFGQNSAVQKVISAILAHDNTKPLVFHLTG